MSGRRDQGQQRLKKKAQREEDVLKISGETRLRHPKSDAGSLGNNDTPRIMPDYKFQAVIEGVTGSRKKEPSEECR